MIGPRSKSEGKSGSDDIIRSFILDSFTGEGKVRAIFLAILLCLLVAGLISVFGGTLLGILNFRDNGRLDSVVLLRVQDLIRTGQMYPSFNRPPFLVTLYGPLSYLLMATAYKTGAILGIRPDIAVRLFALTCFLLCLGAVNVLSRKLNHSAALARFSVLVAASTLVFSIWSTEIRCDFVGIALSMFSVAVVASYRGEKHLWLGAVLAALALLVKQPFLISTVTVFVWLLLYRRFKDAAIWTATIILTVSLGFGIVWWREPLVFAHLSVLRHSILEFHTALLFVGELAWTLPALFGFLGVIQCLPNKEPIHRLMLIYWAFSLAVGLATIPQVGGERNYFFEFLFVSSVFAAAGFKSLVENWARTTTAVTVFCCVLFAFWAFPLLHFELYTTKIEFTHALHFRAEQKEWQAFSSIISGRKLLSTVPEVTVRSSEPLIPDPLTNRVMERFGTWSFDPIVREIEGSDFELIVFSPGYRTGWRGISPWDSRMWEAIDKHYRFACSMSDLEVWVPQQPSTHFSDTSSTDLESRLRSAGCTNQRVTGD